MPSDTLAYDVSSPLTINPRVEFLSIPALDCSEEMALIEKGLSSQPGIVSLDPLYLDRRLRVSYDPQQTDPQRVASAISDLGFQAEVIGAQVAKEGAQRRSLRSYATMVGGGLLLLATLVWLAGWTLGETAGPSWLIAVLCVLSTLVSGAPVARAAWRAVRLRAADMNLLMTIAAVGALAIGEYFEAATAMFLFGVALLLERHSMDRARRAVHALASLTPNVAHRLRGDQATDVEVDALLSGDLVLVKPGERVPADGSVIAGASSVNEAPLTGESVPVEKEPGSDVFAGSLNGEGALTVSVTRATADSTLARIERLVADAQASRGAPTARFVDEFARRYTPAVIAFAILLTVVPPLLGWVGFSWAASVAWHEWFRRALVLLVIACPCALVISTPVTIVCGLYRAARRGLLIKGGEHLERAAAIDCVALDKTGTLTEGRAEVVHVEPASGIERAQVLRVAAALERPSEHPLAAAIVRAAEDADIEPEEVSEFAALRGFGVEGRYRGERAMVGSPRMLQQRFPQFVDQLPTGDIDSATAACVATESGYLGMIYLADQPREDAAEAVSQLRSAGVKTVVVLTGDRAAAAREIARQVGADRFEADLLPEDKVEQVRQLARQYPHLAMVGDGVNDAPALASAGLGVALGTHSSDLALETADVVVMTPHLGRVAELIRLGRKTRRLLWQNITLALSIKAIVLVLAAAGPVTMWMAVAADVGASLLVIANGMRLIR